MIAERAAAASLDGVVKAYGGHRAIDGITLEVPAGGVFALVGPDGAGKTTLIRLICGLAAPTAGSVRVLGESLPGRIAAVRHRLGYLSQRFSLYGDLSIDENIAFAAEIFGMKDYRARRDELLEMTGLTPFRGRLADRLSGGMRQKLALACTLVHDPELILLDEPTNGVDPVSRREFWKLLRGLGGRGITLVMSTPYMDEAERADGVALLHEGRVLLSGNPGDIRGGWDRTIREFLCDRNRAAAARLAEKYPEGETQAFGDRVHLVLPASPDGRGAGGPGGNADPEGERAARWLEESGIRVIRRGTVRPRLENVFLSMIRGEAAHG